MMKFEHWLDNRKNQEDNLLVALNTLLIEMNPQRSKLFGMSKMRSKHWTAIKLLRERGYEKEAEALQKSYESYFNNMGWLHHPDLFTKNHLKLINDLIYKIFQKHPMFEPRT
jgi:hypothetical protein